MAEEYVEKAMDEVYDILLYNPDYIDKSTKKRLLGKMMDFYIDIEEYTKCQHIKELLDMLERPNENSNKKTRPSV
jgi:hypothetical protein|tara:strand:- start:444 stop:668 length:225 start_codon:yes stop_codon:yes gene_type:complete